MKKLLPALLTMLFFGIQSKALAVSATCAIPQPCASVANNAIAEANPVTQCESQIISNKEFNILKGKLDLLNAADQPTEILANSKVPSKKEKPAIALWVEEQKRCSALGIAYHKSQSQEIGAIYENAYAEMYISAADLYQGKLTYGEFARASVRRHQEVREQIAAVIARLYEQQAERARQEATAKELEQQNEREKLARQQEYQLQLQLQARQQQQYQAQQEEFAYQSCMNRARDQFQQASCQMERAGRQLGGAIGSMLNR